MGKESEDGSEDDEEAEGNNRQTEHAIRSVMRALSCLQKRCPTVFPCTWLCHHCSCLFVPVQQILLVLTATAFVCRLQSSRVKPAACV